MAMTMSSRSLQHLPGRVHRPVSLVPAGRTGRRVVCSSAAEAANAVKTPPAAEAVKIPPAAEPTNGVNPPAATQASNGAQQTLAASEAAKGTHAPGKQQQRAITRHPADAFWALGAPSLFRAPRFGSLFRSMEEDLRSMFDHFPAQAPFSALGAADIQETEKAFCITLDLPGMDKENIKVQVDRDRLLTITGQRETSSTTELPSGFHRRERSVGTFRRQFHLPQTVDTSAINAKAEDGVLKVEVPKLEANVSPVTDVNVS